jgi:hypothetical protein
MGYKLTDKQFRAKMRRADVDSLADEIRIGKVLLEERLNSCSEQQRAELLPMFMAALTQLDKLTCDYRRFEEAASRTLTKTNAQALARKLCDIVTSHLKERDVPDWEGIVWAISEDMSKAVNEAKNTVSEPKE